MKPLLFLCLMLALTSCKKDLHVAQQTSTTLEGRWAWTQSSGGFAGHTQTPATTQKTQEIQFGSDHTVRWYENGTLTRQTTYTLTRGKSIYSSDSEVNQITYTDKSIVQSYTVQANQLTLKDECYDCYTSIYQRKTTQE